MTTPLAQLVYSQWSASRPEFYARWEPERTVCVRLSSGRKTQSQNAAPRGPRVQGKLAPFDRHAATLAAAIALPLIILAGLQLYTQVNAERRKLETDSEAQAANVMRISARSCLLKSKLPMSSRSRFHQSPAILPRLMLCPNNSGRRLEPGGRCASRTLPASNCSICASLLAPGHPQRPPALWNSRTIRWVLAVSL